MTTQVTTGVLADSSVTTSKLANSAVTVGKLNASGTPSNTTFLRGDGAWAAPTASGNLRAQLFTASGTWTAPANCTRARVLVIGGGGGGASYNIAGSATGGRGGFGGVVLAMATVTPNTAYTVTVGAGGAGNNAGDGSAGTNSSFGSIATATGGGGGLIASQGTNGSGSVGAGGTLLRSGNMETNGAYVNTAAGPATAGPFLGGLRAAAVSSSSAVAFDPAVDLCAGSGGAGETTSSTGNNATGGVGGIVYIEWIE